MRHLPIWDFCRDLAERLAAPGRERGEYGDSGLTEAGAVYRADPLIEAAADLADVVVSHSAGRVDERTVRHEALRVACMAAQLWLVSLEQTVENAGEEAGDGL